MCDGDLDEILSLISTKINKIFCDREFVACVRDDFNIILKDNKYCVLFPKLKPIFLKVLRYQALIFDLSVFCIGTAPHQKTTVVCKKIKERTDDCPSVPKPKTMESEENLTKSSKKSKTRPTQPFYVPPAQRSVTRKQKVKEHDVTKKGTKQLPKCKGNVEESLFTASNDSLCASQAISSNDDNNSVALDQISSVELTNANDIVQSCENDSTKELPPCATLDCDKKEMNVQIESKNEETEKYDCEKEEHTESSHSAVAPIDTNSTVVEEDVNFSQLYISYNIEDQKKLEDCDTDNEKEEMQRAIENISRKRRPLIKNTHNGNSLWTSESKETSQHSTNLTENAKNLGQLEPDTNDEQSHLACWEDMFDENGELHSEYLGEILKQIGCEVKVVKATNDYSAYENTKYGDLEHVIELYDFPSTLKTQDIMQLYRDASENPMYVKWCDDTHCLLVLSSPAQAQRALQIEHDIIKSRPLECGSTIAIVTANSSDLKPAMKRPQTSMQTARRLINRHLGTKSSLSKEEVELERQALRDAREQRRLERQSEKDAWEGHPRNAKS
ncbi:hypothetical protein PPYR_05864 [Photinus pyralis]|uniref:R3H domain-containing protein n=2 Tax=Photinus pyralis TaxID=7054 RepID=A0A5N4AW97_PHOPY|nr:hypothetical protein PPYR_05864 [Photinus pyralis]